MLSYTTLEYIIRKIPNYHKFQIIINFSSNLIIYRNVLLMENYYVIPSHYTRSADEFLHDGKPHDNKLSINHQ